MACGSGLPEAPVWAKLAVKESCHWSGVVPCIFVGNGDMAMVHRPAYDFDGNVIPNGFSWDAGMAEVRMPG